MTLSNQEQLSALTHLMLKFPRPCANLCFLMAAEQTANLLREIPSIDHLLKHSRCEELLARYNREYVTEQCRAVLEQLRADTSGQGLSQNLARKRPQTAGSWDFLAATRVISRRQRQRTILHTTWARLLSNGQRAMTAVARHR